MPALKSYHFDLGDSSAGPIGYCARVAAYSEEEAVELLKAAMPQEQGIGEHALTPGCSAKIKGPGIEYIQVYFNQDAVNQDSIDDVDEYIFADLS